MDVVAGTLHFVVVSLIQTQFEGRDTLNQVATVQPTRSEPPNPDMQSRTATSHLIHSVTAEPHRPLPVTPP
jgi:hypothetical protein